MSEGLAHIVAQISNSPQRADLIAGFIVLCRTDKNSVRQGDSLVKCSKAILPTQPLLALKLLQVALGIAPKHPVALAMAKEIFKRRGRWASEQRIAELMSTTTNVSALTPLPEDLKASVAEQTIQLPNLETEDTPIPVKYDATIPEAVSTPVVVKPLEEVSPILPNEEQSRVHEYLKRCGFDPTWANLAAGFSRNNAGLSSFVGMLVRLNMIKADERPLASSMLLKMVDERPDQSGEREIIKRFFPELVTSTREGK